MMLNRSRRRWRNEQICLDHFRERVVCQPNQSVNDVSETNHQIDGAPLRAGDLTEGPVSDGLRRRELGESPAQNDEALEEFAGPPGPTEAT